MKKPYFSYETVTTLGWYFGSIGFFGLYFYGSILWKMAIGTIPSGFLSFASSLVSLILSAGFVYFTYTLSTYLRSDKAHILKNFIHISSALFIMLNLVDEIWEVFGPRVIIWNLWVDIALYLVVGGLIWSHLYKNINNLSRKK